MIHSKYDVTYIVKVSGDPEGAEIKARLEGCDREALLQKAGIVGSLVTTLEESEEDANESA